MSPGQPSCCRHVSECFVISDYYSPRYDVDIRSKFYNQGDQPYCVGYSLTSVFSFKGLPHQERLMITTVSEITSLQHAIDLLMKQGGFEIRRKKKFDSFLKNIDPTSIRVLQICSSHREHFNDIRYHDHTHCVTRSQMPTLWK